MSKTHKGSFEYSPLEEKLNVWTHGFGFVASVIALFFFAFAKA